MTELYCVVAGVDGAHEAECVYSLWSSKVKAEAEIARLKKDHVQCGVYEAGWSIAKVAVDAPRDSWIS